MHNSLKDKILDLVDIVEVIGERIPLKPKGREMVGLCPFHDDHKPSFNVSPTKKIFKCWSCGAGGDVIKFVQLYERVNFREALGRLAERAGIDAQVSPEERRRFEARDALRRVMVWARAYFHRNLLETDAGRVALDYAHSRGLSDETIERFGIGLATDAWDDLLQSARRARVPAALLEQGGLVTTNEKGRTYDRFRNRLIFPICDSLGRPIAFGGRTLGDDQAKYLNSPESALFQKSRVLFAFDAARDAMRSDARAVVVEGYLDAVLLHQHGISSAVATLGTALSDSHIKLLKPLVDSVVLCFDGDEAGQRAADRGLETAVQHAVDVRICVLDGGLDPADMVTQKGAAALTNVLSGAQDALQFKWDQTVRSLKQGERRASRSGIEAFLNVVANASVAGGIDPMEQSFLVDRLAGVLSLPSDTVYSMLARARDQVRRQRQYSQGAIEQDEEAYLEMLREVPAGLVGATEQIFGLLLRDSACFAWLDEVFAQAVGYCEAWQRLYDILRELVDDQGGYERRDVLARCDDSVALELASRATECAPVGADPRGCYEVARDRLRAELNVIRIGDLQDSLREPDGDQRFAAMVDVVKAQSVRGKRLFAPGHLRGVGH